jgi:hypothetical protein
MKRISPVAIESLKNALSQIYWYKAELQSFIRNSLNDSNILLKADWNDYKRQIVSDIIDYLASDQEKYLGYLRRLIYDVCQMTNFSHLERLEDGNTKAERARGAVSELRKLVKRHDAIIKEEEDIEHRRKEAAAKLKRSKAVIKRLDEIKDNYIVLIMSNNPQERGKDLEKLMYDIFELFDLDPKASFSIKGEQIDGAFSLEGTNYIFEAKWEQKVISREQLDVFASKVSRKLENTLGLFLAINGFSKDGVDIHSGGRPQFLLMTGADLMAVLEGEIDFISLLRRKKSHAAQTGQILLEIHQFYSK